jgi:hypothetical protein
MNFTSVKAFAVLLCCGMFAQACFDHLVSRSPYSVHQAHSLPELSISAPYSCSFCEAMSHERSIDELLVKIKGFCFTASQINKKAMQNENPQKSHLIVIN